LGNQAQEVSTLKRLFKEWLATITTTGEKLGGTGGKEKGEPDPSNERHPKIKHM